MNELPNAPSLKEINALKKQLNWGEIPAIYHMASISIGDIDGILSHGFDSAYKRLLNKNLWNLKLLGSTKDQHGQIQVTNKPKIMLKHVFNETHFELHCFPVIADGYVKTKVKNNAQCPFIEWSPERMQMLFRLSNFINFMVYTVQKGDEADIALIRFAHFKVEYLIDYLRQFFDIVKVKGKTIATTYAELCKRYADNSTDNLYIIPLHREH
jgi:hypothetical protein